MRSLVAQLYKPSYLADPTLGLSSAGGSSPASRRSVTLADVMRWQDDEGSNALHLAAVYHRASHDEEHRRPDHEGDEADASEEWVQLLMDLLQRVADGTSVQDDARAAEDEQGMQAEHRARLRQALEAEDVLGFTPLHLSALASCSLPEEGLRLQGNVDQGICTGSRSPSTREGCSLGLLEAAARAVGANPAPVSRRWHCTPDDLLRLFHHQSVEPTGLSVRVFDRQQGREERLDVRELAEKCAMKAYAPFYRGTEAYLRYMLTQIMDEESSAAKKHRELYAHMDIPAEDQLLMCWIDEIAGYGVFAGRPYHQHEFIALYSGLLTPHQNLRNTDYAFDTIIPGFCIDARLYRNIGGFINHSAQPNARSVSFIWRGAPCVAIVALRPIERGEQICYAYAQGSTWFHHPTAQADRSFVELLGRASFPSRLDCEQLDASDETSRPLHRCAACMRDEAHATLKRCGVCRIFKYCSVQCQKQDWPIHKKTCPLMVDKSAK